MQISDGGGGTGYVKPPENPPPPPTTTPTVQGQAAAQQGAPVQTDGYQEKTLEQKAKEVVGFNIDRLNTMEQTGKLPPPLPMDQANDNFKTIVDYMMKSPEANSSPEIKAAFQDAMAQANEQYKKAGDNAMPFPVYLAQSIGQNDKIPAPLGLSAVDFTRSYAASQQ